MVYWHRCDAGRAVSGMFPEQPKDWQDCLLRSWSVLRFAKGDMPCLGRSYAAAAVAWKRAGRGLNGFTGLPGDLCGLSSWDDILMTMRMFYGELGLKYVRLDPHIPLEKCIADHTARGPMVMHVADHVMAIMPYGNGDAVVHDTWDALALARKGDMRLLGAFIPF